MCCSHVSFSPRGFLVGMRISPWGSVNARKPGSCHNRLPAGKGRGRRVCHRLLRDAPAGGVAQKEGREQGIDQQDIFYGMVLLLAALTRGLFGRVLGADDASFRPVMGTRGDAGAAAGTATTGAGSSASGVTTLAASATEMPKRCARALRERAGASPRVRSAARRAG